MVSLVLEQSVIDKLTSQETGVEVRDNTGKLIGFFHPAIAPCDVDEYECSVSEDELHRRQNDKGGRPLRHILDDLRKGP